MSDLGTLPTTPETGIKIPVAPGIDFQATIMGNVGQLVIAVKGGAERPMGVLQFRDPEEAINFLAGEFLEWVTRTWPVYKDGGENAE